MPPPLPPGMDSTYTFTQSLPISTTATVIVVALCLLAGWIAWCFAWAYVEECRAESSRPPTVYHLPPKYVDSCGMLHSKPSADYSAPLAEAARPRRKAKKGREKP